ncbi:MULTISPECIES: alpha/beta fold hydrolase [unclassified Paracoccus (in: a-proteobacteria)]|uniref:alpha/beta fold hydrolase n=1 Tax=unclassified Paracoccus (in: a-proteobacteria) TaxID=2688777 RepID=UPI0012B3C7D4|nr:MULTISPECIES: alpha/beta hydrolase [unclassified Paracoccus (in: a-proteobacteria)]UXU74798.1 alpha/beta hydrolase [Paracoccus sp. SMMA_5]UXU80695.1 alpha/beta hydrolase [Paracoccus sp. SMMA_5_TC]
MSALHLRQWPGVVDRPALALHCMMGSGAYWQPIARALADRVRITAPDMPGHGDSPEWAGPPPDYHTHVTREVAALIDRPMDLIGHSMGATVALRIAIAAPEAVRSLTLIEPVLFAAAPDPLQDAVMRHVLDHLKHGRAEDAARIFLDTWGGLDWQGQSPAGRARLARQVTLVADSNPVLREDTAHLLRPNGLENIDAPVMIVMGQDSPAVIAAIADALAARLADVGRAVVPGAGHMLPITHPKQVAEIIGINLDRAQG